MPQFDCHAHVFERLAAVDGARYVPRRPARLKSWLRHCRDFGLSGGVLVQVSFLGHDNSELCAALASLDRARFAGVAGVPLSVEDAELARLRRLGVQGVRWNLVRAEPIPDPRARPTRAFLERLAKHGLHLEIHLEGHRLAPLLPRLLDAGPVIVVDHFGLPSDPDPRRDPWIGSVASARDPTRLYVKFSGAYRTPFDIAPHAAALLSALPPDRVVWGSDWPHTQYEARTDYARAAALREILRMPDDGAAVRALYGLSAPVGASPG